MAVWNPFDEGGLGIIQHAGPLKKLLLYTFFYIPAVIVSTPCYILYVMYVAIRRLINPLYEDAWNGQKAAMIKGYEAIYEANPQGCVGMYFIGQIVINLIYLPPLFLSAFCSSDCGPVRGTSCLLLPGLRRHHQLHHPSEECGREASLHRS